MPSTETSAEHGLRPQEQPARIMGPRFGSSGSGMRTKAVTPGRISSRSAISALTGRGMRYFSVTNPSTFRGKFLLLEALLEKPGRLLTRQVLIERIWGPGWGSRRVLSTLVSRLRALIESNADDPSRIVTIRGIGYRYERTERGRACPP